MDRLSNTVRPYAWGSISAIPEFLGTPATGEPQAELWMGAHPGAPSTVARADGEQSLTDVVAADPEGELGPEAVRAFGPRLPFLLKLLAAASPLSLQVHPDREQARQGFADEEARGVPVNAPERNYKDTNHKPELICALTDFDGLCGFRRARDAADLLAGLDVDALKPYVDILRASPESAALREVLTAVLTADRHEIAATVEEAARAAARLADAGGDDAEGGTPARARAGAYAVCASLAHHYPGDPGVIAAMLLNHVRLHPGEALYLGAGVPHAYLSGLGVEIMANSDNVLRCGLTPKHVDVPELLRIVRFEPGEPAVLRPEAGPGGEELYEVPIGEFRLSRYVVAPGAAVGPVDARTPQILLCTAGHVVLRGAAGQDEGGELPLRRGQSAYVPAGERVAMTGDGTLFRATVDV
ncbi:mannose-6-phosphate isomerase [Streptomyces abyssalis]|uniref:mannose-6-phosphate isomerase n=1 Tax=Streptomyces abyssalis TaxID=933944 RepID=A0A1E7JMA1_9ACTN|nr:mannose-6-phosphate isomerase, class I [Streptomyces abyssalis]OEU87140.1 mannose-6-phosphate isomerase [Streptomyces abyssalis]OEU88972.1 mannose-6-phosphate isomerase [Streptomyces abyssalis]OEV32175.1 mannose-6-phosphate isomerase [Streptomyces nanshensis]